MINNIPLFHNKSRDYLAQFSLGMFFLYASGLVLPGIFVFIGLKASLLTVIIVAIMVLGLKSELTIYKYKVVIYKSCYGIPYRRYKASHIEEIWGGGDWGDFDECLVFVLDGKEINYGSGDTSQLEALHNKIIPFVGKDHHPSETNT